MKTGKKRKPVLQAVSQDARYSAAAACDLVKTSASFARFDESVDVAVRLGVDPKHADQMVRGALVLPHGTGKNVRVLVFAKGEKAKEAEEAGADIVGADELVAKVSNGFLDFDTVVATPDMMGQVGRLGKVLGPRGLMPNPKVGTVTMDVSKAVREAKAGKIEFRVEKAGIIHAPIGKKSFASEALQANLKALLAAILKAKPPAAKGTYLKSITLSSTMGAGIRLDPATIDAEAP